MSKELEALDIQGNFINCFKELLTKTDHNVLQVNITRNMAQEIVNLYEQHKNAKPSEAIECLEKLKGMKISSMPFSDEYGTQEVDLNDIRKVGSQLNTDFREYTDTIKQALIKAQEQEKVLEVIKGKRVNILLFLDSLLYSGLEYYNSHMAFIYLKLTQDEFELLKRWVGNGN